MKHKYLKNVATLSYSEGKCVGCGRCAEVCPHGVFYSNGKKACVLDKDSCMECGACAMNCPAGAIEVSAGTGCAIAIIAGWLTGKEPTCDCSSGECC